MSLILCLETATQVCSVALAKNDEIIAIRESKEHNSHSALITIFIEEVMKESGYQLNELDTIAVSKGPGSYTGLRIGVSTAKGLCFSLNKPLIAIETLEGMASYQFTQLAQKKGNEKTLLVPMIDARRMEVYMAIFDAKGQRQTITSAEIINADSFENKSSNPILLFGDGAPKFKDLFQENKNISILDHFTTSAAHLILPALERLKNEQFEDLAYFEPYYLKTFVAGKPTVKGLYD
ncbi:MAG: tRNA (adenosine(37)-N6)-threonylcarbamoyltransferase complex dimerization subunit type 1 TsaB [Bacteroidetes bacterium]|nr:tRNA (adenosine(37)-N6)-threonylcarbamoyltransferase complex dimerization subunit type 1 TsaB [Bacteroidota bacterium]